MNGKEMSTILKAGLIVGTLDITAACVQFFINTGKGPAPVLRYIASSLFSRGAYNSDAMVIIGLVLHYLIAIGFTFLFFALVRKSSWLKQHRLATGILFGACIWMVMNLAVVPLSQAPQAPLTVGSALISVGILILCIGLPLSLWLYPKRAKP